MCKELVREVPLATIQPDKYVGAGRVASFPLAAGLELSQKHATDLYTCSLRASTGHGGVTTVGGKGGLSINLTVSLIEDLVQDRLVGALLTRFY